MAMKSNWICFNPKITQYKYNSLFFKHDKSNIFNHIFLFNTEFGNNPRKTIQILR